MQFIHNQSFKTFSKNFKENICIYNWSFKKFLEKENIKNKLIYFTDKSLSAYYITIF